MLGNRTERRGLPGRSAAAVGRPARPGRRGARSCWPPSTATPRSLLNTYLGQRVAAILDFLYQRGAADDLDDHLRTLADNDVAAMEGGFALTRFITWAIPILGFLGTVLGITTAIHGATPEVLEKSLSTVTDGLSYAFDATALALALTMITMFLSFLVERDEQGVLDAVDRYVDRCLAHRFQRVGADAGPFVQAVRENDQALLECVGGLVQRQAELWAETVAAMDRRAEEAHARPREQLIEALEKGLEKTLDGPRRAPGRAGKQGRRANGPADGADGGAGGRGARHRPRTAGGAGSRGRGRVGPGRDHRPAARGRERTSSICKPYCTRTWPALASAGNFEQAVHSLTAAVHLLTARAAAQSGPALRLGKAA